MSINVKRKGSYELVQTDEDYKILVLDGKESYDWLEYPHGEYLALSTAGYQRENTVAQGDYVVMSARHESGWENDVDYLGLNEDGERYHMYKIPFGLPTDERQKKRLLDFNQYMSADKLNSLLMKPRDIS